MARVTIEISEAVEMYIIHQSIKYKFKGKIKPFLEHKLKGEYESQNKKEIGNKQEKLKL
jgi:hypothetical protein